MPPNELERRIPYSQLVEWIAFEKVEGPILPHERLDVAGALIAFVTAKSHGAKNVRLNDFLPKWDREVAEQTPEQLGEIMEGLASLPSQP